MKRVLIVDDHHSVTKACRRLFGDLGARDVLTASNARMGYHSYVTQRPDIAIIDLKLGSDAVAGLSLIRRMRVHNPAVVIVALSMNDDPATRQDAFDAGATAFVSKDAPIGELLQACEFWQEKACSVTRGWDMKRIAGFASIVLGVGLASHALGADLAVRPPPEVIVPVAPTWTGFYVGVNGGWGWTNSNNGNGTLTLTDTVGGALFSPVTIASANHNAQSALFGGQIGYNWQVGRWVLGVEGDIDGADIRGSQAIVFPGSSLLGAGGNGFLTQKQEWLASARARIGYTADNGMIYFSAGGAWTNVQLSGGATISGIGGDTASPFSISTTRSGYVIGGGYERMIDANWLVRAEYLYYGFTGAVSGSNSFPVLPAVVTVNTQNFNTSVARIGLSYKLDWGQH